MKNGKDNVSQLDWDCFGIRTEKLSQVTGKKDVWVSLLPPRSDPG